MSYYKVGKVYGKNKAPSSVINIEACKTGDNIQISTTNITSAVVSSKGMSTSSPEIFGPPFWFTLHNGAAHYPIKASPITAQRMKGFIQGIPVMLPCETCSDHATAHIEANRNRLDEIVSGRECLFKFFVDFHNYVNKRYNKPEISLEDAYKIYTNPTTITRFHYE